MKFFLSILLLLTTAFYVLPVKEILTAGHDICNVDMDEEKEDINKKEKAKELFSSSNIYTIIKDTYSHTHHFLTLSVPVLLHTIETPPPDVA
jgi:type III secretory pathway component EscU